MQRHPLDPSKVKLSPREAQITQLLTQGIFASKDIARRAGISARTVDQYLGSLMSELGFLGRSVLLLWALANPGAARQEWVSSEHAGGCLCQYCDDSDGGLQKAA